MYLQMLPAILENSCNMVCHYKAKLPILQQVSTYLNLVTDIKKIFTNL